MPLSLNINTGSITKTGACETHFKLEYLFLSNCT